MPVSKRSSITYSKNFTLSLSNYCQNQCGYCFYNYRIPKPNGMGNVILLKKENMLKIIEKAIQFNCKESLIMSGEKPDIFPEVKL